MIDLLGIQWENGPDHLQASTNAAPILLQEDGRVVGLRFPKTGNDSTGRGVFLSVGLESLPSDATAPNNRASVLGNALEFLVPGLRGLSSVALNSDAFTVPGTGLVEVSDSKRASSNSVVVLMTTTSATNPVAVECFATVVRGVFRGRFVLVDPASGSGGSSVPGAPARIVARHRDTASISYTDAAGRSVSTQAAIDTVPPVLSGMASDPAYNEAVITWQTDKPCDALVRFGESGGDEKFLTRSAYSAELGTSHEVLVTGLLPDRDYYFVLVSRDSAGNAATDNNAGKLYRFRTLKPVSPPWLDDLESGTEGWAVYNDDSALGGGGTDDGEDGGGGMSSSGWSYGTPSNSHGVHAHSGDSCWATNLSGDAVDFAITDLITPAISLVGGNRARLTFWHQFDFSTASAGSDDEFGDLTIEAAQLDVSPDNGASWKPLYANSVESTDGWVQESLDLTPYLGQVVRFRFNYQLFSFTASERLGWLIDDVGVSIQSVAETALLITNNLAQARFVVASGTNQWIGEGTSWKTNLPAGNYSIAWAPVRFFQTPAPQSFTLGASTNRTVLRGSYGFTDSNTNGISDSWETRYFGALIPDAATRDSDKDGAPDLMEFLAGTDPTDPKSFLAISIPKELPNRTVELRWPTLDGREYFLEVSTDLVSWTPFTDARRGDGNETSSTLPALDPKITYLFRVRVRP
jgi:hypothetical protein